MADTIAFKSLYPYYSLDGVGLTLKSWDTTKTVTLNMTDPVSTSTTQAQFRTNFDTSDFLTDNTSGISDIIDPTNWVNPIDSTGSLADIYELKTQWNNTGTQCLAPKHYWSDPASNFAPSLSINGYTVSGCSFDSFTYTLDSSGRPSSVTFSGVRITTQGVELLTPTKTSDSVAYDQYYLGGRFGLLSDTSTATSIWYGLFTPQTGDVLAFEWGTQYLTYFPMWSANLSNRTGTWRATLSTVGSPLQLTADSGRVTVSINEVPQ